MQEVTATRKPSAIRGAIEGARGFAPLGRPLRSTSTMRKPGRSRPVSQLPTAVRLGVNTAAIGGASQVGRTTTATVDGAAMHRKP